MKGIIPSGHTFSKVLYLPRIPLIPSGFTFLKVLYLLVTIYEPEINFPCIYLWCAVPTLVNVAVTKRELFALKTTLTVRVGVGQHTFSKVLYLPGIPLIPSGYTFSKVFVKGMNIPFQRYLNRENTFELPGYTFERYSIPLIPLRCIHFQRYFQRYNTLRTYLSKV